MDTPCKSFISGAYCSQLPLGSAVRKGVPRDVIKELQHWTGFEAFFIPSYSTFLLYGAVAPTDEERVAANSGGIKGYSLRLR
jgi:hypothetical protein